MFRKTAFFLALVLMLSSCTMVLVDEIRGGHSPMMQLNGKWDVEEYVRVENGETEDAREAERVWLDATRDQGDYCEGTWMEVIQTSDEEFLWGIDEDGTEFVINNAGTDEFWEVTKQTKNEFHVQREEQGVTYRMKLKK